MGFKNRCFLGLVIMAARITLCYFACQLYFEEIADVGMIIFAICFGLFTCGVCCCLPGVTSKHGCDTTVNNRKLSDKERKRCWTRFYMIFFWIITPILQIAVIIDTYTYN